MPVPKQILDEKEKERQAQAAKAQQETDAAAGGSAASAAHTAQTGTAQKSEQTASHTGTQTSRMSLHDLTTKGIPFQYETKTVDLNTLNDKKVISMAATIAQLPFSMKATSLLQKWRSVSAFKNAPMAGNSPAL